MDDKENANITFHIYGGNNQILPNATTANQNFYGGRGLHDKSDGEKDMDDLLASAAARLSVYINKVEDLDTYLVTGCRMYRCRGLGQSHRQHG